MLNTLKQSELCRQVSKALGHGITKPAISHMKKRRKKPLVLRAEGRNVCLSSYNKGMCIQWWWGGPGPKESEIIDQ